MKITKIKIQNFRLLKDFSLDLEEDLSLVIGKNNSGKTSLLSILQKFLNNPTPKSFSFDDFNIDFRKQLKGMVNNEEGAKLLNWGISLKLFIKYEEADNLANISEVMMDLDPNNNFVVLSFAYFLPEDNFQKLVSDYRNFKAKEVAENPDQAAADQNIFNDFLRKNHTEYFVVSKKSLAYDLPSEGEMEKEFIDLAKENIRTDKILSFKLISAKREVSNKDSDKTLSLLSSEYYEKKEEAEKNSPEIQEFKDQLNRTDKYLNRVYEKLFETITDKVEQFGGIQKGDSSINIISTLQHKELLKGNTTVMYDHHEDFLLPESYNGLGYLNLISMIFKIEVLIGEFRKDHNLNEKPADINLLFIEEPEAHTHPQMQYVFINNIKDILRKASDGKDGTKFNLQTIISTHSSHIAAESSFDDIKYFYKQDKKEVIAKNLKDLEKEYGADEKQSFKFLKQYLTLHRAELFFADKAIFIEGDTERILLPAMMKKLDQNDKADGSVIIPILSQNISIVEVGAYSHIFEKFIDFIGLKSLIITDIDSAKKVIKDKDGQQVVVIKKCRVEDPEASITTNESLKFFFGVNGLESFKDKPLIEKVLSKNTDTKKWVHSGNGNVLIVYQITETNSGNLSYCASSFEDAFFHLNRSLIATNKDSFISLKNKNHFDDDQNDAYTLAEKCVGKKPSFAMEILLKSETDADGKEFSNWVSPMYIKEGISWLKQS